jgi:transposase
MPQAEVIVGVDVSMARLDVALWLRGESFSISTDPPGVEQLLKRMLELRPQAVVIEASGGPGDLLVGELCAAGVPVAVVNRVKCASSHAVLGTWPRLIASMRWCWRSSDTLRKAMDGLR